MKIGLPFLLECDTVEDSVRLCRELDFDFVELNMNFPACRAAMEHISGLAALQRSTGVGFTIHMDEECDPFTLNPHVRRAWHDSLRETIGKARQLGVPVLNMHLAKGNYVTLPDKRVFLYECYPAEFEEAAYRLREVGEAALEGSGMRIAIENTTGFLPHEMKALDILLASPAFGLTLDIGHCNEADNVDEPFYLAHEEKLIHMHYHDGRGARSHMALGDGEIDLQGRLDMAKRAGTRLLLEVKTAEALRKSAPVLRKMLEQ